MDYKIKQKNEEGLTRENLLRSKLKVYMGKNSLRTNDVAKEIGVSPKTLDNYLKEYAVSDRTLSLVENFLEIKSDEEVVVLTANEYKFISSLKLDTDFNKARAVGRLIAITSINASGVYTDMLLGEGADREKVIARLYKAITTGNWVVNKERLFYIQLPSGHYATEVSNEFGDIRVEWSTKKNLHTIIYNSYEEALEAFPEFEAYIKEGEDDRGLQQIAKIL